MITKREIEAINQVTKFQVVTTTFLHEVVYYKSSLRYCQKRLKMLCEDYKELKRDRKSIHSEYVYYKDKKPKQLLHKLMLSEFYKHLNRYVDIVKFEPEYKLSDYSLRADAFTAYKGLKNRLSFVEIDISKNKFQDKLDKYIHFAKAEGYKQYGWPIMPDLIVVTTKKLPKVNEFELIPITVDFSNMETIFKTR